MISLFLYSLVCLGFVNSLEKPDLKSVEKQELNSIGFLNFERVNEGLPTVDYDQDLTRLAKNEAERLAELGKLNSPSFEDDQNFVGFSYKITGKIQNNISKFLLFRFFRE